MMKTDFYPFHFYATFELIYAEQKFASIVYGVLSISPRSDKSYQRLRNILNAATAIQFTLHSHGTFSMASCMQHNV